MQCNDKNQNTLARLRLGPRQNWVHIPHKEQTRRSGSQNHKAPTQQVKWQHTQHRHGDPDSKPVAVEGQHVEEIGLAAEIFGCAPDDGGDEEGIGVDCTECEGEGGKVVFVRRSCSIGVDGFDDGGDYEEDEHYRGRNPEWTFCREYSYEKKEYTLVQEQMSLINVDWLRTFLVLNSGNRFKSGRNECLP